MIIDGISPSIDHPGSTLLGIRYDHKSYFTRTLDQPKLCVSPKTFASAFNTEGFLSLKLHEGKIEKELNKIGQIE
jgi:hypothetical protein